MSVVLTRLGTPTEPGTASAPLSRVQPTLELATAPLAASNSVAASTPGPPARSANDAALVNPVPPRPVQTVSAQVPAAPVPAPLQEFTPTQLEPFVLDAGPQVPLANWVESTHVTPLRAGPTDDAARFSELPAGSYLKVLERRADWILGVYGGDGETRAPGTAWVRAANVAPPTAPPRWVRSYTPTILWSRSDTAASRVDDVSQWTWLELLGKERQGRLLVRSIGDSIHRPSEGWVEARDVGPSRNLTREELPRAYPLTASPDALRLSVPYRSQLDGSSYAGANCGPATLGMALAAIGVSASSAQLRREVLDAQQLWGDDVGAFIDALAAVARTHGARVVDLFQAGGLKHWSVDDVRREVRAGHPVVAQVWYRALPGRAESPYDGDHYIVITGLIGDDFLYNDSINSDGIGYDRLMTAAEMTGAMDASDAQYAYAGFALARW